MILKTKVKLYPSVFVHIPKCGGSSIKQILKDTSDKSTIHNKLKDDIELLEKENKNFKKYFIFTMLRNPWDRIISYYFFYKDIIKTNEKVSLNAKKYNFSDWLNIIYDCQEEFYFICENYLDYLTYENDLLVDYIMNFYFFKEEIIKLRKILNFSCDLVHVNKTIHVNYKKYYSDDNIQVVKNIYNKDIVFFEFDFEKTENMKKINNEKKIEIILNKKLSM